MATFALTDKAVLLRSEDDVAESERLLGALHTVLHARFGIDHTTIQLEPEPPAVLRIQSAGPV